MRKFIPLFVVIGVFIIIVVIPTFIVLPFSENTQGKTKTKDEIAQQPNPTAEASVPLNQEFVAVLRSDSSHVENIPLETYIVGVVAMEMPANFEMEALKAQALAARTYVVKAKLSKGAEDSNADVTDTVQDQVYKNDDELKKIWGQDYDWKINRIRQAVKETENQVITFDNQLITASFFSTSNGRTENSEEYWTNQLPYLRSVESLWDRNSPKYEFEQTMPVASFESKLGVQVSSEGSIGEVLQRTTGNRIGKINISGKEFTGKQIRELLGLKSSDFEINRKGKTISIITKGFGHGVGMSQYGANGMAVEGKSYQEIISYYYQGTKIANAADFFPNMLANKQ